MKYFTLAIGVSMALSTCSYAGGDIAPVEPEIIVPVMEDETNNWFVYLAGGISNLDVTSSVTPGAEISPKSLDDKGSLVELGLGYSLSKNVFATLSGQRTNLDFVTLDTLYGSINYQFSDVMLKPYVGVLAGYSRLNWDTRPHQPHIIPYDEDLTSTTAAYGVQVGAEHAFTQSWSVFAKYQYVKYDNHIMEIDAAVTTIEHNSAQNILGGIQYAF